MQNCYIKVNEGSSNIILTLKGNNQYVFRLCKRFKSLRMINEYVKKNINFHQQIKREYKFFADLLQSEEQIIVDKCKNDLDFKHLSMFLLKQQIILDDDEIFLIKIPNCLPEVIFNVDTIDYYSKIYNDFILECKPKWNIMCLYEMELYSNYLNSDENSKAMFCRNCVKSDGDFKKPFKFCYNGCKGNSILNKHQDLLGYLMSSNNIITKIYELQKNLQERIIKNDKDCLFLINFLVSLRDLTLFIDFKKKKAAIIDLDYKNIENKNEFFIKMKKEWKYIERNKTKTDEEVYNKKMNTGDYM